MEQLAITAGQVVSLPTEHATLPLLQHHHLQRFLRMGSAEALALLLALDLRLAIAAGTSNAFGDLDVT